MSKIDEHVDEQTKAAKEEVSYRNYPHLKSSNPRSDRRSASPQSNLCLCRSLRAPEILLIISLGPSTQVSAHPSKQQSPLAGQSVSVWPIEKE